MLLVATISYWYMSDTTILIFLLKGLFMLSESWSEGAIPLMKYDLFIKGVDCVSCFPGQVGLIGLFPAEDIINGS